MPKILNFVKKIHYYSKLFTSLLRLVDVRKDDLAKTDSQISAKIVFAGAGGGTLSVLQKAGIPQVKGHALSWI